MSGLLFPDMQPRRVVGVNSTSGNAYVKDGDDIIELEMYVGPNGGAQFRRPQPAPIDQQGKREPVPVANRWAGCDQVGGT